MRVSKRGQITIPRRLRDQFGFGDDTEIDFKPTPEGLLITKHGDHAEHGGTSSSNQELSPRSPAAIQLMESRIHAGAIGVDIVAGILDSDVLGDGVTVDEFIEELRGR